MLKPAAAQQPAPSVVRTACVKVPANNTAAFESLAVDVMTKVSPVAIKKNLNAGVTLSRLVIPAGSEADCDYIVGWGYEGPPPEPTPEANEALFQEAGLGSYSAFLKKLDAVSELVRMEIWSITARAGTPAQKGDYFRLNQMRIKPGQQSGWNDVETKLWKPVMEARAADGELRGWATYSRVVPAGTDMPYQAITVDVFPSWDKMWRQKPIGDFVKKAHPGMQLDDFLAKTDASRDLIHSDLFQVVFANHK